MASHAALTFRFLPVRTSATVVTSSLPTRAPRPDHSHANGRRKPVLPLCRLAALLIPAALALVPAARADERPFRDVIDTEVRAGWKQQKLTPADPADDATFLRRVHLDLVGTIPTADEAARFLDDRAAERSAAFGGCRP